MIWGVMRHERRVLEWLSVHTIVKYGAFWRGITLGMDCLMAGSVTSAEVEMGWGNGENAIIAWG